MKKFLNIAIAFSAAFLSAGCAKENPFADGPEADATGRLYTKAMLVELRDDENVVKNLPTRAQTPSAADFTVDFIKEGDTAPVKSYLYSEMPEIVELPAGRYEAHARHGENPSADWDSPYYHGLTSFLIEAGKITEDVEPITARLANVRVSIYFDANLTSAMSADAAVAVKVGQSGNLSFTKGNEGTSGYFAYVADSNTLAATFEGDVEGFHTVETKTYDNVAPGNHYRITFKMHKPSDDDTGDADASLKVDATVELENKNVDITTDDEYLKDDRPGSDEGGDTPQPPVPAGDKPVITAVAPVSIEPGAVNEIADLESCVLNVTSEPGITSFKVKIESNELTVDELRDTAGFTLDENGMLDLVNPPGNDASVLTGLGLPCNVGGQKSVKFDITSFLMLFPWPDSTHKFILYVGNENGVTTATLTLHAE